MRVFLQETRWKRCLDSLGVGGFGVNVIGQFVSCSGDGDQGEGDVGNDPNDFVSRMEIDEIVEFSWRQPQFH